MMEISRRRVPIVAQMKSLISSVLGLTRLAFIACLLFAGVVLAADYPEEVECNYKWFKPSEYPMTLLNEYKDQKIFSGSTWPCTFVKRGYFTSMLVKALEIRANKSLSGYGPSRLIDIGGSPYEREIIKAENLGIITIKTHKKFYPTRDISRFEALSLTVKTYEHYCDVISAKSYPRFEDTPNSGVMRDFMLKGFTQGLVTGYKVDENQSGYYPREFRPHKVVPRHETVGFIEKLVEQIKSCEPKGEIDVESSYNFGTVKVGSSKKRTFSVRNRGKGNLSGIVVYDNGRYFDLVDGCRNQTLRPNGSCTFAITFKPTVSGNDSAIVTITAKNASNNPRKLSISGTGEEPKEPEIVIIPSTSTINFGEVEVGKSKSSKSLPSAPFTIRNDGNADLSITNIATSHSSEFKVQGNCVKTIPANGSSSGGGKGGSSGSNSCSFSVVFTPNSEGAKNAVLTIRSNAGTKTVQLNGTGKKPAEAIIKVSTTALSFGDVEIGQSPSKSFTISNTGNADLKVNQIVSSNGFSATPNCGTLKPNTSPCTVTVTFTPTKSEPYSYTLNITSNATNGSKSVVLTGKGIEPAKPVINMSKSSLPFGDVEIGQSPNDSFNITNTGKADLKISAIGKGGDGFSVAHNCGTLKPNGSCQVTVTFKPTKANHNHTLNITSNASNGSTKSVVLTGNGKEPLKVELRVDSSELNSGILEGKTKTVYVKLSRQPTNDVSVTLSKSSEENAKISIQSGSNLTFTPSDWNVYKPVTLKAEEDDNTKHGTATILVDASGDIASKNVVVNEIDKDKTIKLELVKISSDNIQPGDNFDVTLRFVPDDEKPADGIQVFIEFDPDKLKANSITNAGALDFELTNNIGEDYINFAAISLFNDVPTEAFDLVTINFTALEATNGIDTILHFDTEKTTVSSDGEFLHQPYEDIPISIGGKPVLALSPSTSQEFGEVEVGQSLKKAFIIRNEGHAELSDIQISSNQSEFKIEGSCEKVNPGEQCEFKVIFEPSDVQVYNSELTVSSNGGTQKVELSGTGIAVVTKKSLKCKVSLLGRPQGPPDPGWKTTLNISIGDKEYLEITTDNTGACETELPEPPTGTTLSACAKGQSHTLRKKIDGIEIPPTEEIDFGELIVGDFSDDNKLHPNDFTIANNHVGQCQSDNEPSYDSKFDIDGKGGCVTKDDILTLQSIWKEHLAKPSDVEVLGDECNVGKGKGSGKRATTARRSLRDGGETVALNTLPIPSNLVVGTAFDVTIQVHATTKQSVESVVAALNFDPQLLRINSLKAGERLDFVLRDYFDNTLGIANFIAMLLDNTLPTETFTLVTVNFTLLGEGGEHSLTFNNTAPRQTDAILDGKSVLNRQGGEIVFADDNVVDTNNTVSGYITDVFGNSIANAQVVIGDLEAISDDKGYYELTNVSAGNHAVNVTSEGYKFPTQSVAVNGNVTLDIPAESDAAFECPIYAVQDHRVSDSQIFVIDPTTKAVRDLGPLYKKHDIEGLAIDQATGTLYGTSGDKTDKQGHLYRIDRETGELTDIGPTGYIEVDSLAIRPSDGTFWGWAVGDGLITIDSEIGQGTLVIPYDKPFVEDMVWSLNGNYLYATQGRNLWSYDGEILQLACDNLPGEVEAIEMLPNNALMFAFHQDNSARIHVLDIESCEVIVEEAIDTPYKDIEGMAWWFGCMSQ